MKVTIEQAFMLEQIYNQLRDKPLPIRTAYKVSKLVKATEGELDFYRDSLQKILDECAVKDEKGQFILNADQSSVQLIPEKMDDCAARIKELQNVELDINCDIKFNFDELEMLNLSLQDIAAFEPFIEE